MLNILFSGLFGWLVGGEIGSFMLLTPHQRAMRKYNRQTKIHNAYNVIKNGPIQPISPGKPPVVCQSAPQIVSGPVRGLKPGFSTDPLAHDLNQCISFPANIHLT